MSSPCWRVAGEGEENLNLLIKGKKIQRWGQEKGKDFMSQK